MLPRSSPLRYEEELVPFGNAKNAVLPEPLHNVNFFAVVQLAPVSHVGIEQLDPPFFVHALIALASAIDPELPDPVAYTPVFLT